MKQSGWFLFWWAVLGIAVHAATTTDAVTSVVTPARIFRHPFDLKHPPSNMPKLTPPEVGVCQFEFNCEMESRIEAQETPTGTVTGRFKSTKLTTRLTIHIWTPLNAPAKIIAHEEAHREICERYYRLAEGVARRLGAQGLATSVRLTSQNPEALKAAVRKMQDPLIVQFMNETARRCNFAQDRFDAITNHSLNPIDEASAITQAMTDEAVHFRTEKKS